MGMFVVMYSDLIGWKSLIVVMNGADVVIAVRVPVLLIREFALWRFALLALN
jgi:hypothetical protein